MSFERVPPNPVCHRCHPIEARFLLAIQSLSGGLQDRMRLENQLCGRWLATTRWHLALGGGQQPARQRQPGRLAAARGAAQQQSATLIDLHVGKRIAALPG